MIKFNALDKNEQLAIIALAPSASFVQSFFDCDLDTQESGRITHTYTRLGSSNVVRQVSVWDYSPAWLHSLTSFAVVLPEHSTPENWGPEFVKAQMTFQEA